MPSASLHWKMQRLSAIALIPLTLWFIMSIASLAHADYTTVHQWISTPLTIGLLILFVSLSAHHAILGMQVVLEDYVSEPLFTQFFTVIRIVLFIATALSLIAIVKIALETL
ncbi:MAG: succinate dehydrogenase, hydrophobic membrane anchor protein [Chromatiales bacterium]|nr:succinate dehydrogenase, hydrophobic membrane anchor protein [Chromatiales bacterium]